MAFISVVLLSTVSLWLFSLKQTNDEYQKITTEEIQLKLLSEQITILMLNARRAEKDFLLRLDESYIAKVDKQQRGSPEIRELPSP